MLHQRDSIGEDSDLFSEDEVTSVYGGDKLANRYSNDKQIELDEALKRRHQVLSNTSNESKALMGTMIS